MIVGLRLRFTPEELKSHMAGRSRYHRDRADLKEKELEKAKEIANALKASQQPEDVTKMAKGYSHTSNASSAEDLVESLETAVRDHRNKALAFDCFSLHLMDEDYDLGEADLVRLEVLNR